MRLATAIEQVRERKEQENEPVLVFSAGDYLGGGHPSAGSPLKGLPPPS